MNRMSFLLTGVLITLVSACSQTTLSVQTQAPPGFTSAVDIDTSTLTISRGLAAVLECNVTSDGYSGPCLDLIVDVQGDAVDVFDAHLDAVAGLNIYNRNAETDVAVSQPPERSAIAIAARDLGTSTVTLTSNGPPVTLAVVVIAPPGVTE